MITRTIVTTVRQGKLVVRVTLSVSIVQQVGETRPAIPLRHAWNASQGEKAIVVAQNALHAQRVKVMRTEALRIVCHAYQDGLETLLDSQIASSARKVRLLIVEAPKFVMSAPGADTQEMTVPWRVWIVQQGRIRHPKRP